MTSDQQEIGPANEEWSAKVLEGDGETDLRGGGIQITAAGLVHRQEGRARLYPWHQVLRVEWSGSTPGTRSAIAQAASLSVDEDPYHADEK